MSSRLIAFLRPLVTAPLLAVPSLLLAAAPADNYPNKPLRLVAPYAPGGGTDILARLIGAKLSEALGQTVVVDNRPGAGGIIGTDIVAKSPPDGHTLMLASPSPIVVAPHLHKKLPYDPLRDLAPITLITNVPAVMAVHPSVPARTVGELIKFAKSKPGTINYSSSGNGGTGHLAGEMLKTMAGIQMTHIPYKGTGPATAALVSGEVNLSFGNIISVLPHVKGGRIVGLAVTTEKRSPVMPDLPSVAETLPGYAAGPFYGVLAPAGTPPAIIARLNREIVKILFSPDVKNNLSSEGAEPIGSSPAEFARLLKSETERWGAVVKQAGIRVE